MLEPEVEFLPRADYFKRLCSGIGRRVLETKLWIGFYKFCCRLLVLPPPCLQLRLPSSVHRCEVALIEALRHRQVPSTVVSCVIILCSHHGVVAMLKIIVVAVFASSILEGKLEQSFIKRRPFSHV